MTLPGLMAAPCGTSFRRSSSKEASCGRGVPFRSRMSCTFKLMSASTSPGVTRRWRKMSAAAGNWPIIAGDMSVHGCMKKLGLTAHVRPSRAKCTMASLSWSAPYAA